MGFSINAMVVADRPQVQYAGAYCGDDHFLVPTLCDRWYDLQYSAYCRQDQLSALDTRPSKASAWTSLWASAGTGSLLADGYRALDSQK